MRKPLVVVAEAEKQKGRQSFQNMVSFSTREKEKKGSHPNI